MSELTRLRDWANNMAENDAVIRHRKLWRQIADEIDAFLAGSILEPLDNQDELFAAHKGEDAEVTG